MKAIYFQPGPVQLDVIGVPDKGFVDLGRDKEILVRAVPVSADKTPGTCLLEDERPKADEPAKAAEAVKAAEPAKVSAK